MVQQSRGSKLATLEWAVWPRGWQPHSRLSSLGRRCTAAVGCRYTWDSQGRQGLCLKRRGPGCRSHAAHQCLQCSVGARCRSIHHTCSSTHSTLSWLIGTAGLHPGLVRVVHSHQPASHAFLRDQQAQPRQPITTGEPTCQRHGQLCSGGLQAGAPLGSNLGLAGLTASLPLHNCKQAGRWQ